MCSRFCACISSLLNVKTQLVLRNRKLLPWSNFFWSRIWIKLRRNDFNPMIMYDQSIIEELPFILLNNSEQIASCIIIDNWFQFYGTFLPRTFIKERYLNGLSLVNKNSAITKADINWQTIIRPRDQWKLLQCGLRTRHFPSFFVPTAGHLTSQMSQPPGISHPRKKEMLMPRS